LDSYGIGKGGEYLDQKSVPKKDSVPWNCKVEERRVSLYIAANLYAGFVY
jgi:hypothetical protein